MDQFQDWTSCEWYGHLYEDVEDRPGWRKCMNPACGDEYKE